VRPANGGMTSLASTTLGPCCQQSIFRRESNERGQHAVRDRPGT
jgi:hypothetical protein